jgi:hypothetical protein
MGGIAGQNSSAIRDVFYYGQINDQTLFGSNSRGVEIAGIAGYNVSLTAIITRAVSQAIWNLNSSVTAFNLNTFGKICAVNSAGGSIVQAKALNTPIKAAAGHGEILGDQASLLNLTTIGDFPTGSDWDVDTYGSDDANSTWIMYTSGISLAQPGNHGDIANYFDIYTSLGF